MGIFGPSVRGGDGRSYSDRNNDGRYRENMGSGRGSGTKSYTRSEVEKGPNNRAERRR